MVALVSGALGACAQNHVGMVQPGGTVPATSHYRSMAAPTVLEISMNWTYATISLVPLMEALVIGRL